jgi:septal ring-binding cell division protein DamX
MALKKSEKNLVGIASIAVGGAIIMMVAMPQWDGWNASNNQVNSLKEEIKNLATQQSSLEGQVAILRQHTDVPSNITIRTYNEENREQIIKSLLDHVVNLAVSAGNRFISLKPSDAAPMIAPPPKTGAVATTPASTSTTTTTSTTSTTPAAATTTTTTSTTATANAEAAAAVAPPPLTTFGYDLSVRGSYDTLQRFLRVMGQQKELLEIVSLTLDNEAVHGKPGSNGAPDPNRPLKLTAHLRLAIQPER